jgi:hypothetical protein
VQQQIGATLREGYATGRYSNPANNGRHFRGGPFVDAVAEALGPAGFVREHYVRWGDGRTDFYRLDFAHIEARVNIELDGPYHYSTPEEDALRDTRLRELGWRVIRIRH